MSESNSGSSDFLDKLILGKYRLKEQIGEGSFGKIYKAESESVLYAIKFEKRSEHKRSLLETESKIMTYLKGPGIPKIYSYSIYNNYNLMVMQLLGKNLNSLLNRTKDKKLSLKTICMLGIEMMKILKFIHDKHIIHRDIKPDNFAMDYKKGKTLYLFDFGLAKQYRSSKTLEHHAMKINKKLIGTARFASINALRGNDQSRRDDLESVGYVLMYLLIGSLPWQIVDAKTKEERYSKILYKKEIIPPEELCKGYPKELVSYLKYTRKLEYEEDPNYDYLIELFKKIIENNLYENIDYRYDWNINKENKLKDKEGDISFISKENNTSNKLNILTINNIDNTIIEYKTIGEENKNNLRYNSNPNIKINISINNNNNNINIRNDNKIIIGDKERKKKLKKKIKKNEKDKDNKKENKKMKNEKIKEEDYYDEIFKEYKINNEKDNNSINSEEKETETEKKLCCLII